MTYLVAIADILGFKRLVAQMPARELGDKVWRIVEMADTRRHRAWTSTINGVANPTRVTSVDVLHFSDTLLFASRLEEIAADGQSLDGMAMEMNGLNFLRYIAEIAFAAFIERLPLRIGLSCGDLFVDTQRKIVVGQALIDAYQVESAQEWIGGALHDSFPQSLFAARSFFRKWDVPLKPGHQKITRALEWFRAAWFVEGMAGAGPDRLFQSFREALDDQRQNAPARDRKKYDNLEMFFTTFLATDPILNFQPRRPAP